MTAIWRTQLVIDLCQAMRETQDYTALPLLADALEESGYMDEAILSSMRAFSYPIDAQRMVALVYSAETAEAVANIESIANSLTPGIIDDLDEHYAEPIPMTYRRLMAAANLWVACEGYTAEHGSENWRDDFPAMADRFWNNYEVVTGTHVKSKESFFCCSC